MRHNINAGEFGPHTAPADMLGELGGGVRVCDVEDEEVGSVAEVGKDALEVVGMPFSELACK